jgi:hypothetical protein
MISTTLYEMSRVSRDSPKQLRYDLAVVGGGADERAYQVLKLAPEVGYSFDTVILCDFIERNAPEDIDAKNAYQSYASLKLNFKLLECSVRDPSACLKSMRNKGIRFNADSKVAVDISSFTRPYCFALLKYLQDFCGLKSVDVFYTEPMSYRIPKGLIRSYRKSLGSLSVMEVPGFPGRDAGMKNSALIVTFGFDGDLSTFISDEVTPTEIIVINGFPAYSPKFKDISLINNERLLNYSGALDDILYCPASNPFEVFNILRQLRTKRPDTFFNIAPLGPKPMALGACMFALSDESVRIIYPMPEKYATVTTDRCWHSWLMLIPWASGCC